ncbi:MAG: cache domain-containing protein [Desulfobacteraceae bacterium]|nr:cache domain-containing protein [Desulfobacteraceae bacterium]
MTDSNETSIVRSARRKIICAGLILSLIFVCFSSYLAYEYMGKTKGQRLLHLKQTVEIARNSIEPVLVQYRKQNLSRETALNEVRNLIRRMVYKDHAGNNYIFMSSYKGIMLVQPFEPEKELTDVWGLKDSYGNYIIRSLVEAAKSREGKGYVSYHYQRPGQTSPQEKISYVVGIPELECYIGTGQYMADLRRDQLNYIIETTALTSVSLIILFFLVWASMKEIRSQNKLLHKAEHELSAIFNNAFQLIGTLSCDGRLTKINRSALDLIVRDEKEVIGKYFWDTPWWNDNHGRNILKKAVHDCSKGLFSRFDITYNHPGQDKSFLDFSLSPIFNENGNVIFLLAEGRDMTEQIKTKNDLIMEKEFSENLIKSLPGLFFLYKLENNSFVLKKWNSQHEELLGLSSNELQNISINSFVEKESLFDLKASVEHVLEYGSVKVELYLKCKNDESIPFLFMARSFDQSGDKFIVGTGIELTEQKKAQEDNKKLERMLNHSQKMQSVGRLAGGVAHDFNNMLGVIMGHSELALLKVDENHELYSNLKEIQAAASRSADITKQLLAFARKQTISPRPLDLNNTVESMLNMLRRLIGEDIDLIFAPSDHIWAVKMDPSQIDQILVNLCVNARDAIDGAGRITIETSRKTFDDQYCSIHHGFIPGDFTMLTVSDNGCGMNRDVMDNLYEPFFTTKDVGQGTGLGLATVYGIVKQNNGFINVYSEPGHGSTFNIYFPRFAGDEDTDIVDTEKKTSEGGTETVLLVEDEPMILEMTTTMLEMLGYKVLSASSPAEAILLAKDHISTVDLLITDVVMPEMNGRDLAKEVSILYPNIRLLFMSGYTANVIARQGVLYEGVEFIQKPFSMADMTAKVREVLDSKRGVTL